METPLRKLRILEIGTLESVGMAGMLLSDLGAEVIRIDAQPLDGAETVQSVEDAVTFGLTAGGDRLCDRGKKRVSLDLRDAGQRDLFKRLLATCDGLLDGCSLRAMAEVGLDEEALQAVSPDLVHTRISGYGGFGPYADRLWSEAVIQAESGFVSTTGMEGGDPVRSGGDMATALGGLMGCIAMLMGLLGRYKAAGSRAREIDVSLMDSVLFGLENQFSLYLKSGVIPRPKGNNYALSAPVGNFRCKDGEEIMISVATEAQWKAFAEVLGREDWLAYPEFSNVSQRIAHYKLLGEEVSAEFARYTRAELMEILQRRSCVYGCINDFPAVVNHRQVAQRGTFAEVTGSDGGVFLAPMHPLTDCGRPECRIIHAPGADTESILGELQSS